MEAATVLEPGGYGHVALSPLASILSDVALLQVVVCARVFDICFLDSAWDLDRRWLIQRVSSWELTLMLSLKPSQIAGLGL